MTPAEALAQHLTQRPEMPQPFNPNWPEAIAWHRAFQWWVTRKEQLEMLATVPKTEDADRRPLVCRAEVEYARPAKRPEWSTKEYNREKQAEHRRKQSPEEKAKRLEARKKWDAAHRERKRLIREALTERGVAA